MQRDFAYKFQGKVVTPDYRMKQMKELVEKGDKGRTRKNVSKLEFLGEEEIVEFKFTLGRFSPNEKNRKKQQK